MPGCRGPKRFASGPLDFFFSEAGEVPPQLLPRIAKARASAVSRAARIPYHLLLLFCRRRLPRPGGGVVETGFGLRLGLIFWARWLSRPGPPKALCGRGRYYG
jgi:hypothetical protein